MGKADVNLQAAAGAYQRGEFAVAIEICRAVLAQNASNIDALNILAVSLAATGQRADALAVFDHAAAAHPDEASLYLNQANVHAAGSDEEELDRAGAAYRRATSLQPGLADAWLNWGALLHRRGRLDAATAVFRDMARHHPRDVRGLFNLGRCLIDGGDAGAAIAPLREALKVDPNGAAVRVALSDALSEIKDHSASLEQLRLAQAAGSVADDVASRLPFVLAAADRIDDAERAFSDYHRRHPFSPDRVQAFHRLIGQTHQSAGRYVQALRAYQTALAASGPKPEIHHNIGEIFATIDLLDDAIAQARQAHALAPADGRFAYNIGILSLKAGRLAEGWPFYEHRFYEDSSEQRTFKKKYPEPPRYWRGEPLEGKHFLIWREQGLGDEILGASMLPDLFAAGARITFLCNGRMASIYRRSFTGIDILTSPADVDARRSSFDYQLPIGSLGGFFRKDFASFPGHGGYLSADSAKAARLREKYADMAKGRKIVGISWRSKNDEFGPAKSADLRAWAGILRAPNAFFVNLQYGETREERDIVCRELGVEVFSDPDVDALGDLDDFFAQVAALDLVLSTSNTTVHVAGALNTPCWVLLPWGRASMWYWFSDRTDSPWYPSVVLYRQPGRPDTVPERIDPIWWQDPIARVGRDLTAWAQRG